MSEPLHYATYQPHTHRPILVATVLGVLSLGLIVLGGCFLIGVGMMYDLFSFGVAPKTLSASEMAYCIVLYFCAGLCLLGAAVLMVLSVRKLLAA